MVAIVTFGFKPEAFVAEQGSPAWFPDRPRREDLDDIVDAVRLGIEREGHALAIYPSWRAEPVLRRLETARSVIDERRLVLYGTSLPPLAGSVFAALASAVAGSLPSAGALIASLPALERELVVMAWLGSVARLRAPSPSVLQHVASWWPRSAFAAFFWPQPTVRRLRRDDRQVPAPTTYRPQCLAIAARDGDDEWVENAVLPAFGSAPVKEVTPTELGPQWWGTGRLIEIVAYPVDVPVTARRISQGLAHAHCRWCGEPVSSSQCPFCRIDLTPAGAGAVEAMPA